MELSGPAILAPRPGLATARPGEVPGADDPYFAGIHGELADKGFLVAAADDLIRSYRSCSTT